MYLLPLHFRVRECVRKALLLKFLVLYEYAWHQWQPKSYNISKCWFAHRFHIRPRTRIDISRSRSSKRTEHTQQWMWSVIKYTRILAMHVINVAANANTVVKIYRLPSQL